MKTLTPFLFVPVTLGWALPGPGQPGEDARLGGLGPRRTDTVDQVASHVVSLQRVSHQQHPRTYWANSLARYLENRIDRLAADADPAQWTPLRLVQNNSYTAVIEIGGEKLEVIVDTGSSDTWVLQKNYACYGLDNRGIRRKVSNSMCGLGSPFNGTFKDGAVTGVARYDLVYADGSQIAGQLGYQDITIAGITVKKQEFVLIDEVSYQGDGVTSGILGLAYPIVVRAFDTTDPRKRIPGSAAHKKYDPIFTTMHKRGLVSPGVFSVAMDRKNASGYLAFGGLPPVAMSADFAKTPIRIVEADGATALRNELSFYTIVPDAFVLGAFDTKNAEYVNPSWNASHYKDVSASQIPVILDTGTTMSLLPTGLLVAYFRQIPGGFLQAQGTYWALCNAKLPKLGVTIGGKTFYFRDEDIMYQEVRGGQEENYCQLGLTDLAPDGPYILGESFLNAVVAVFDVAASEIRLYERR